MCVQTYSNIVPAVRMVFSPVPRPFNSPRNVLWLITISFHPFNVRSNLFQRRSLRSKCVQTCSNIIPAVQRVFRSVQTLFQAHQSVHRPLTMSFHTFQTYWTDLNTLWTAGTMFEQVWTLFERRERRWNKIERKLKGWNDIVISLNTFRGEFEGVGTGLNTIRTAGTMLE